MEGRLDGITFPSLCIAPESPGISQDGLGGLTHVYGVALYFRAPQAWFSLASHDFRVLKVSIFLYHKNEHQWPGTVGGCATNSRLGNSWKTGSRTCGM